MLFVPKWKSSAWHLPSNSFHSHRLHNVSNFCSKLILNWMSAWRSCSSGSLETEQDCLKTHWAASQPSSPVHLSPPNTVLETTPGCLQHWSSPADSLFCRQSRNTWLVSSWEMITAANITQWGKYQRWPTALSSLALCFELSCCVWGCLGGVSPNSDLKPTRLHRSSYHPWLVMHLQGLNQEENLAKVVLVVSEERGTFQREVMGCEPGAWSLFFFLLFFVFLLAGSSSLLDFWALLVFLLSYCVSSHSDKHIISSLFFPPRTSSIFKKYKRKILC